MTDAQLALLLRRLRAAASAPSHFRPLRRRLLSVREIVQGLISEPSPAELCRLLRLPEVRQRLLRALAPSGSRSPGLPRTGVRPPAKGSAPPRTDG